MSSKVTLAARERCSASTLQEQLLAMRVVELALLEKRAKLLKAEIARMEAEADQADIATAFAADKVQPEALPKYTAHSCDIEGCAVCDPTYGL